MGVRLLCCQVYWYISTKLLHLLWSLQLLLPDCIRFSCCSLIASALWLVCLWSCACSTKYSKYENRMSLVQYRYQPLPPVPASPSSTSLSLQYQQRYDHFLSLSSFAPAANRYAMGPPGLKLRLANKCSILSIYYSYRGKEQSKRKFWSTGSSISFRVDSSVCSDAEEELVTHFKQQTFSQKSFLNKGDLAIIHIWTVGSVIKFLSIII